MSVNIRFYIDPETGLPHIYKHGVERVKWKTYLKVLAKIALAATAHVSRSVKLAMDGFFVLFMSVIRSRTASLS